MLEEVQEAAKPLEFRNDFLPNETGKDFEGAPAGDSPEKLEQTGKSIGEEKEGKKGGCFSRMVATQKERTQKELRAEEAARLRREAKVQSGGADGMFNREF